MIKLTEVHYTYPNGVHAIRGVSLSIESGCTCLLGHNGAGKTTLFRHLNGLLKPDRGVVEVAGLDTRASRTAALARWVGLAFQNPDTQLFKETVIDEIRFGAENGRRQTGSPAVLTDWATEIMDLKQVIHKNPYDLLLCVRKRVALASVIAMDTPVVVLDEPTGGQDAHGVDLIGNLVRKLLEQGKLVVISTHDIEFARRYGQKLVVLAAGEIVQSGSPDVVFANRELLRKAGVDAPAVAQLALALGADHGIATEVELLSWLRQHKPAFAAAQGGIDG